MRSRELSPVDERAYARLGNVLKEKWRLDDLVGVGGMAAVYAATHRNGKRVAVKIMHPEMSANRDLTERFLREGYVANKVAHSGAVSILDDDVAEDGSAFIVMELLEGETLDQMWRRAENRLPTDRVLNIAEKLLDVLAEAHSKGIVHRDIKPENVFLTVDGQVKVLDFGIAHLRELSLGDQLGGGKTSGATMAGLTMGTPGFMSPEQARGESIDGRTDLWSVGATMFTLLTGRQVHDADTVNLQLAAAMMEEAPSLASVAPRLSPDLCALVDRALAFDVRCRWPDARSMQRAAMAIAKESEGGIRVSSDYVAAGGTALPSIRPDMQSPGWRDHIAANWKVSAIALLITAVVAGAIFLRPASKTAPAAAPAMANTAMNAAATQIDSIPAAEAIVAAPAPAPATAPSVALSVAPSGTAPPAKEDPVASPRSTSRPTPRAPATPATAAPRAGGNTANPGAGATATPWPLSSTPAADPLRRRK